MKVDIQDIQRCMDGIYKRYRTQGTISRENMFVLKEILDQVMDEIMLKQQHETKSREKNAEAYQDQDVENQIKMIKALRMNNPLWDVQ